ncbi:hypothetical protein GCM10009733_060730 [Nonomuraea maheshkhaliensis]|uniref:Uncharacterized protein n=1 Tax=Nonomuraea maheshkhaliensis TaxID=419590 RepID=A0ABP4RJ58_9ACTN
MSRRIVIPGVAAVLMGAAVAGWLWLRGDDPRPTTLHAELTSAFYAAIDTRQRDTTPLTTEEVFPPATRSLAGMGQVSTRQFTDCDELLWGTSATGCTQALQATYAGGSMAGQFVIFNLADGRAADALVSALREDGFVRQDVAFEPVGSLAQVRAMGHYVTVSWTGTTRPTQPGRTPAGSEPFGQLNEPIQSDQRDESGQPAQPTETGREGRPSGTDQPGQPAETDQPRQRAQSTETGQSWQSTEIGQSGQSAEMGRPEQPAEVGRPRKSTDTGEPSDVGRGRSAGTEQLGGPTGTSRPGRPAESTQPADPGPTTQLAQPGQDLVAALIALDGLGRAVQGRVVAAT